MNVKVSTGSNINKKMSFEKDKTNDYLPTVKSENKLQKVLNAFKEVQDNFKDTNMKDSLIEEFKKDVKNNSEKGTEISSEQAYSSP